MWWKKFQIFFSQNLEKISGPKAIFWQTDREYIPYLFWFFAFWRNFAPQRNAGSNVFYENSWKYLANTYLPSYAHIFVARIFWQRNYILSESVGGGVRGLGIEPGICPVLERYFAFWSVLFCLLEGDHERDEASTLEWTRTHVETEISRSSWREGGRRGAADFATIEKRKKGRSTRRRGRRKTSGNEEEEEEEEEAEEQQQEGGIFGRNDDAGSSGGDAGGRGTGSSFPRLFSSFDSLQLAMAVRPQSDRTSFLRSCHRSTAVLFLLRSSFQRLLRYPHARQLHQHACLQTILWYHHFRHQLCVPHHLVRPLMISCRLFFFPSFPAFGVSRIFP